MCFVCMPPSQAEWHIKILYWFGDRSHYIAQAGLMPASHLSCQSAGITGTCYHSRLKFNWFMILAASDPTGPLGADCCQSPLHHSRLEGGLVCSDFSLMEHQINSLFRWHMCV